MASMDLAVLGLEVRSDGVVVASQRLNTLEQTSRRTETATNGLSNSMNGATRSMNATTNAANSLNKMLSTLGISMATAYAIKTVADFEKSMAQVKAITRATGAEFDALNNKAKELGRETRFSTAEAAEAMRFLAQAGFTTNEVLISSRDVLSLAQAGSLGLADAAEIASKALRSFQLEASEMNRVADLMAKVFSVANTNVQELGDAFRYVAPVSTAFGVSMEDTTAAIAALSDAGISASMAGTGLRGILVRLSNPTKQAQRALEDAGLTMKDLDIKSRGLLPVLESLANSTLTVEQAMVIFGQRAGPAFEVIRSAIPKTKQLAESFQDISGYAQETAKIMDGNLEGAIKHLISAIDGAFIDFGQFTGITETATKALNNLADTITKLTKTVLAPYWDKAAVAIGLYVVATKAAAIWTGATTGALAGQVTLIQMVAARYGILAAASTALTGALGALRAMVVSLAASPAFWVVALGTALYGLYDAIKSHDAETQRLIDSFREVGEAAKEATEEIKIMEDNARLQKINQATEKLAESMKTLDERTQSFAKSIDNSLDRSARSAMPSIERQIGSVKEAMFGFEEGTIQAGKALRDMYAELNAATTMTQKLQATNKAMKTLNQLANLFPQLQSIKAATKQVEILGGALGEVVKAEQELDKANTAIDKIGKDAEKTNEILKDLEDLMKAINKQTLIKPQSYEEAYDWLVKFTASTDAAKIQQWELEKAAAAAALEILEEAHNLAISNGEMQKATTIWAQILDLRTKVSQVKPPKLDNLNKEADKIAKAYQSAIDKVKELQMNILELQYEINGASERELEVIRLKAQREQALSDIYRRNAEATGQIYNNQNAALNAATKLAAVSPKTTAATESVRSAPAQSKKSISERAKPYMDIIKKAAAQYGVPKDVILAVIQTESGFNAGAVSPTGVKGLMQVTQSTYKGLGFTGDRSDPLNSVLAGTKLLSQLYKQYQNWSDAFTAYNGGADAVKGMHTGNWGVWTGKAGKQKEIRNYAKKVNSYRQGGDVTSEGSGAIAMENARQVEQASKITTQALNEQTAVLEGLTNKYFDMKQGVAEFALSYDPALTQMEHGIKAMEAMGLSTDEATIKLKELQLQMLQDPQNPSFGTDKTLREIELLTSEIQRLKDVMYNTGGQETAQLTQDIEFLNAAMNQGLITTDQYTQRLVDLGMQMATLHQQMGESTWTEDLTLALGAITEGYTTLAAGLSESWGGFFSSFTQGFADSIGQAIVYSENLDDALTNVAKSAVASLISSLVQLGIQYVVNAALAQTVAATSMATSAGLAAASGSAMAAAYAPAAALASLASFGSNSAGAMAGITATMAMTKGLAMMPGFESGGYTGTGNSSDIAGLVHKNEFVFDAETTKRLGTNNLENLANGSNMSLGGNDRAVNVTINNYGTPLQVESADYVTGDQAEEIAIRVVDQRAGNVVANELLNPYSNVAKSMNAAYNSPRRT